MPPRRRCAAMSMSNPAERSAARSAMVAFEPGSTTRSASPGSAAPGRTRTRSTDGSASSGSRSSKLAMCGRIGTAMRSARLRFRRPALLQRERIFRRQQARIREVRDQAERLPSGRLRDALHARSKQRGIAAKFVDDEAATSAASSGASTALVPTRLRSRRRGRYRRSGRPAHRRRAQIPYWRCRWRAD